MVARDTNRIAEFYKTVFGCDDIRPRKTLSGERISRGNGVPDSEIYCAWLSLPGVDEAFLEIHQHKNTIDRLTPLANEPGYGHLSFEVGDIQATFAAVIKAGGEPLGEVTDLGTTEAPCLVIYMRDPEGNIVELEQR